MLLTTPVYISTYMVFFIICTVYSSDTGSMKCSNEWIDGNNMNIFCIINETSLNTCPGGITGFADFTFTQNGSTIAIIQCTVDKINVDCRNVLNSDGCGCQDHSGGNYVINYNITADKTIHSGGSWGCAADCLKIPTQGCSNIKFVIDVGGSCGGTNTQSCKTGLSCDANKCMIDAGGSCAGTNATNCKTGLICEANKCRIDVGGSCGGTNTQNCKTGLSCDADKCMINVGESCAGTNATKCKNGLSCEEEKCIAKNQPCPTWCIIVIVVVISLGIAIIIFIIVVTRYLTSRLHWRCVCVCCNASTPNEMHRGKCCLCCCLIPNTRPTQDKGQQLEHRNGSGASH